MALTTKTTVDGTIPELWSKILLNAREKNLILVPLFDHRYEAEAGGKNFDLVKVDGVDNFAEAAESYSDVSDVNSNLTFRAGVMMTQRLIPASGAWRHFYKAFATTHEADILGHPGLFDAWVGKVAYEVALEMDTYFAGFIDNFSQTEGSLAVPVTEDNIMRCVQYLNDANAPRNDRFMALSAAEDNNLKKFERFTNADYARAVGSLPTDRGIGFAGSIHGLSVHTSTNIEGTNAAGHDNGVWQREAVAVISKEMLRVEGPVKDIESDTKQYIAHSFYMGAEMRDDHAIWLKGL